MIFFGADFSYIQGVSVMKNILQLIFISSIMFLCSCTMHDARHSSPAPAALPVGSNWQIIEEPPKLSNDQGRLPFQAEQSVQPEGAKSATPAENRTIKTPQ
jgi:hypothetical protein